MESISTRPDHIGRRELALPSPTSRIQLKEQPCTHFALVIMRRPRRAGLGVLSPRRAPNLGKVRRCSCLRLIPLPGTGDVLLAPTMISHPFAYVAPNPRQAPSLSSTAQPREELPQPPASGAPACGPTSAACLLLALEPQEGCWTAEFKDYLTQGTLLEKEEDAERVARQATAYCIQDGELY